MTENYHRSVAARRHPGPRAGRRGRRFAMAATSPMPSRPRRQADVAIVFATQWMTEGMDVPDLSLPDGQDALIAAVAAANPRTIVVLETGGPVLMPWLDATAAVLEAWYPGARGAEAIAAVLFGEENPSGRLPVTLPGGAGAVAAAGTAGRGNRRAGIRAAMAGPVRRSPSTTTSKARTSAIAGSRAPAGGRCFRSASACPIRRFATSPLQAECRQGCRGGMQRQQHGQARRGRSRAGVPRVRERCGHPAARGLSAHAACPRRVARVRLVVDPRLVGALERRRLAHRRGQIPPCDRALGRGLDAPVEIALRERRWRP